MKKKISLDAIKVESFVTGTENVKGGVTDPSMYSLCEGFCIDIRDEW